MILSIDQGTTGTTAMLIDEAGKTVDRAYCEIKQYYPKQIGRASCRERVCHRV